MQQCVCEWMGGGDEAGVCVCLYECCVHSYGSGVFSNLYTATQGRDTVVFQCLRSSASSTPTKYIYTYTHVSCYLHAYLSS